MDGEADIPRLLEQEITAVERFVGLLVREQGALQDGDADRLAATRDEKTTLIDELAALADTRNRHFAAAGLAADGDGLAQWVDRGGSSRLRDRLLELATEARTINALNGKLIALQLNHTQAALAALSGTSTRGGLYGRNGQTHLGVGYRLIDSA